MVRLQSDKYLHPIDFNGTYFRVDVPRLVLYLITAVLQKYKC